MEKVLQSILMSSLIILGVTHVKGQLQIGFYAKTCPNAESIVSSVVEEAVVSDPSVAATLLRLHFHDCFVQGCDGSILINRGEANEERNAIAHQGVAGFQVIDKAKFQLENVCTGVVSCADIVTLAARDAIALRFGPEYVVPTGRRDGEVSDKSKADGMPDVDDSIQVLKSKFAQLGLSPQDLVLLSAAHTIGTTACFFMPKRLYNFTGKGDSDPSINLAFLQQLKTNCPLGGDPNARISLDPFTSLRFDDQILRNIRTGFAVISSDARLLDDPDTRVVLDSYINEFPIGERFGRDFAVAMVKMGSIGVNTRENGEIRRVCSSFN